MTHSTAKSPPACTRWRLRRKRRRELRLASLHEYFVKDGVQNITMDQTWPLTNAKGVELGKVTARLHLDFDANAKYISFYVPEIHDLECPEAFIPNETKGILQWPETQVEIQAGRAEEGKDARQL